MKLVANQHVAVHRGGWSKGSYPARRIAAPQLVMPGALARPRVDADHGPIDLRRERLDLVFYPEPKDPSIFALRSPIHLEGAFKDPAVRPEAGPIVARIAGAALLAAVNPLLALLPFIETGPGKDSDCAKLLAHVRAKGAVKKQ